MAVDTNGDLLVLDRGDGGGTANPPKIITVRLDPLKVTRTALQTVIEPLSLLVEPDGRLIIGDGREQAPTGPAQFAGNLVRVDRSTATWTETTLLGADNPLVAPTGLARTGDGQLYVLDAGLKPFDPSGADPFTCPVADPAGVFSVDVDAAPPTVARTRRPGSSSIRPAWWRPGTGWSSAIPASSRWPACSRSCRGSVPSSSTS